MKIKNKDAENLYIEIAALHSAVARCQRDLWPIESACFYKTGHTFIEVSRQPIDDNDYGGGFHPGPTFKVSYRCENCGISKTESQ